MPQSAIDCINSWKKFLPDYEIKEWNEDNFDLDLYPYTREAYNSKKYAFVTDVVRLYAIYHEGGIYMDTDVEVLKSMDRFLQHEAFSGFESNDNIPTGLMASKRESNWAKEMLDYYNGRHFILDNGELDQTTNTTIITNLMTPKGVILNNTFQEVEGLTLYPSEYFCPKDHTTGSIRLTPNSYCIHHFNGSWLSKDKRARHKIKTTLIKLFGEKLINGLLSFIRGRRLVL